MSGHVVERRRNKGVTYQGRVSVTDPATGHRRMLTRTFPRKREAQAWVAQTVTDLGRGAMVMPDTTTVGELLETWLATVATGSVRDTTRYDYELAIRNHLIPAFGRVRVQDLTTVAIQRWYAEATAGARTLQVCHQLLRQALERAVDWGIVVANPVARAKPPAAPPRQFQTWSPEEAGRFLAANRAQPLHAAYVLALATGLRQGEVFGLRWADVDLEGGALAIRQQVVVHHGVRLADLKTAASRRRIALPAEAVAALREQRRSVVERRLAAHTWEDLDLVFPTAVGTPMFPSNVTKRFKAAIRRAKVRDIRFHDLRHTHATWLLQAGVPVKVVSERLGHTTVRLTLDTYAHVLPDMQQQAAEAIDGLLAGAGGWRSPSGPHEGETGAIKREV